MMLAGEGNLAVSGLTFFLYHAEILLMKQAYEVVDFVACLGQLYP